MVEDTAANVLRLGQSERNARAQRAELAARPLLSISAFRAKFGLRVILLSAVRVGVLFQGKSMRKSIAGNGADANHHASGPAARGPLAM